MTMTQTPRRRTRNIAEKRERIIAAAQILFTQRGYSQTSIKEIAERAEVAVGLVNRHFESKLKLFEAALIEALTHSSLASSERSSFGEQVAEVIFDRTRQVATPAMTILSMEDEDARRVTMKVVREYAIKPGAEWLGGPMAVERAIYMNVLGLSLSLLDRLFNEDQTMTPQSLPVRWIVEAIQDAVARIPACSDSPQETASENCSASQ
jgi:AcrR family transcriptional regulator